MAVNESVVRDMVHSVQKELFTLSTKFAMDKKYDLNHTLEAIKQFKADVAYQEKRLADFEKEIYLQDVQDEFYNNTMGESFFKLDYSDLFSALHDFSLDEAKHILESINNDIHAIEDIVLPSLNEYIVNHLRKKYLS